MTNRLPPAARLLGFAGLLPQLAFVAMGLLRPDPGWALLAFGYASLILSFLGGVWWGVAVTRRGAGAELLAISVAPSLVALALLATALSTLTLRWPLVLLGSALMLTLLVDRGLTARGDVPPDWMRLRAPLSLGLGALTILAATM